MRKNTLKIKSSKAKAAYRRKLTIRSKVSGTPEAPRICFNKSNKNHRDLQEYIRSLAQLDFVEDIFNIRMTLTNGDLKRATETGIVGTLQLPEGGL